MMGGVTCPNCGKDNPDFSDNCQFCQTPLRRESTLNIGENPTKKLSGELEGILPNWLREGGQQGRESAEEEAKKEATKPRVEKVEPPDLLAGLAFQAASDEDEVPDWLAAINPVEKKMPAPSKPAEEEPSDFFAQFNKPAPASTPASPETTQNETPAWMADSKDESQKDELAGWFAQSSEQSGDALPFNFGASQSDNLVAPVSQEPAKPAEPEDLGWLHDLESSANQTPASNQADTNWTANLPSTSARTSDSQDDLSWLNNLGGTPAPSFDKPAPSQPSPQDDLSWLNNLGNTSAPSFDTPAPPQPAPQEDLSWLTNLGGTPAPTFDTPAPSQPTSQEDLSWLNNLGSTPTPSFDEPASQPAPQEDLSWLNSLGGTSAPSFDEPAPAQPASSQDDLGWLSNLGDVPAASEPASFAQPEEADWLKNIDNQQNTSATPTPLSPAHTAPLSPEAAQSMPDWLRSATESAAMPSMPPLGATSMDWFTSQEKPAADQTPQPSGQTPSESASLDQNTRNESSSLSNQDVDSLFAVDMPDWLSKPAESATDSTSTSVGISSEAGDELAPVSLPSWVQAMRPVEAALSDVSAVSADQNTEKEGPLAGLRGVIPFAPIGSAQRPKSISLKLQATEEQQTTAALLEQILASETTAHPLKIASFVVSQRVLRWSLTAIFLIVLGVMIGLGSQIVPVLVTSPQMAEDIKNMSATIQSIPESAPVLVVIDYEPALTGELEAAAGPLLDQLVVARKPNLTFISNSPNGSALAERLMTNTKINQALSAGGLWYQLGSQYFNIGYLPGGSAGVQGFVAQPKVVMPAVDVNLFSDFAAVIVISDHAESGLVWIEQLQLMKQANPTLATQPLLVVASAQAGSLLQPYVSSKQVNGMITGLSDAARYEFMNNSRPGIARSYWDAFGVGLIMAVLAIVIGSLWSLIAGIRARRAEAELG